MKNSISRILQAVGLSVACAGSGSVIAQNTTKATPVLSPSTQSVPQTVSDQKNRTRVRRATPRSRTQPAAKSSAATAQSPAPTSDQKSAPSPASEETKPPVATPAVVAEPQSEPKAEPQSEPASEPEAEPTSEEKAKSLVVEVPTPAERLRQQLRVVDQMIAAGLKREAIAELQSLSAEDRFDPQGFYNIANAFARLDATDDAVRTYRKAIEQRRGHYSRASNNLGVVLLRQGFWDQAYEALLAALRAENFHYAEASYNLGRLYAARGEMDRAMREWRRAVAVDPGHTAAARALGNIHSLDSASVSNGVSSPDRPPVSSVVLSPEKPAVSSVSPAGKPAEKVSAGASPVNRPAEKTSPKAVTSRNERSKATTASGARFTVDGDTHTLLQRARTSHERARYGEAIADFRSVIKRMGGYFSPANLELSYSLMELRRYDEAIASLLLVAQRDGARLPISYYHLARLYELRGDLEHAEDYFTRAAASYVGENPQFLLNLSGVREKRGNFPGALAAMEEYVKRKEQHGEKPEWSDARLASLRGKVASAQSPPKQ